MRERRENQAEENQSSVAEPFAARSERREIVEGAAAPPGDKENENSPHPQTGPDEECEQRERQHRDTADCATDTTPGESLFIVTTVELNHGAPGSAP